MAESFRVRVEKDYLVFCAGHFITFAGNICERLHGHNYRMAVEVAGPLDENQYVVDFIALRDAARRLVDELDHRMLLPAHHPTIRVTRDDAEVTARFESRRWVFPREDCVILPMANTTAELLARYLGQRLVDELSARSGVQPHEVRVEIDECQGQQGIWTWTPGGE